MGHCFQPLKTHRIKHHGVVQWLQLVWCNRFVSTQNPQLSSRDLSQKADTRRIPNPEPLFSIKCSLRRNKASTFPTKSRFYSATFPTACECPRAIVVHDGIFNGFAFPEKGAYVGIRDATQCFLARRPFELGYRGRTHTHTMLWGAI